MDEKQPVQELPEPNVTWWSVPWVSFASSIPYLKLKKSAIQKHQEGRPNTKHNKNEPKTERKKKKLGPTKVYSP